MGQQFRRAYLRAPLNSSLLYEDDGHVFKASTINISEGGVLLENLPRIPPINAMPLMINLPFLPELSRHRMDQLLSRSSSDYERVIIRAKAKMVRTFDVQDEVEQIFINRIGCEFVTFSGESLEMIKQYVARFAKNTIYLLSLFENHANRHEQIYFLRHVAELLGYQAQLPLPRLRQNVLHDYQSLESL